MFWKRTFLNTWYVHARVRVRGPTIRLIFLKYCRESYLFATLRWVSKDENMKPNKFPQPIGHYISH